MNLSSSVLKTRARDSLRGNYGEALLICIIPSILLSLTNSVTGIFSLIGNDLFLEFHPIADSFNFNIVLSFFPGLSLSSVLAVVLGGALSIGASAYFLHLADRSNPHLSDLLSRFKPFGNTVLMQFIITVFTTLWSLLFIIPGIVAAYRYSLTPYILAENPDMPAMDAIKLSKKMMRGNKGKMFILDLSFIGWYLLSLLTFGIGSIFLLPYIEASKAEFFNEVSGKNYEKAQNGFSQNTQYGAEYQSPQNTEAYYSPRKEENTDENREKDGNTDNLFRENE